jgi:hypothetical protein
MNLDDLRRELRNRAGEPGTTSMTDRLAGVQSKVVAARRRKAVASGVAVVASLAVVGLASTQLIDRDDDLANTDLVQMPDSLNGDSLIADGYNESGESKLTVAARLDTLDVVVRAECALPDGIVPPEPDEQLMLAVEISGGASSFNEIKCRPAAESGPTSVGPANPAEWRSLKLRPGDEAEATVSLQQGAEDVDVPGAQFGVAFYEKSGDRVHRGDVELEERLDIGDETYQLVQLRTHRLTEGGRIVRLRTPASEAPFMLVYGWKSPIPSAAFELRQDGELLTSDYGGEIKGPRPLDSETAHRLVLAAGGISVDGTVVLAYYELVDD